jgi:hypothetical protein
MASVRGGAPAMVTLPTIGMNTAAHPAATQIRRDNLGMAAK